MHYHALSFYEIVIQWKSNYKIKHMGVMIFLYQYFLFCFIFNWCFFIDTFLLYHSLLRRLFILINLLFSKLIIIFHATTSKSFSHIISIKKIMSCYPDRIKSAYYKVYFTRKGSKSKQRLQLPLISELLTLTMANKTKQTN